MEYDVDVGMEDHDAISLDAAKEATMSWLSSSPATVIATTTTKIPRPDAASNTGMTALGVAHVFHPVD
jgi:hypothetical protein